MAMERAQTDSAKLVYLTELTGMRLIGPNGARIGRVREAAVVPREHARRVARFLFGTGHTRFAVRWDQVLAFSDDGIQLSDEIFSPYYDNDYHLLLTKDLLDQQIIDVNGRKVVRVNDLALRVRSNGNEQLWVDEVGVGLQGAFRRLAEGLLPNRVIRQIQQKIPPNSIPWRACNIVEPDPQRRLRLRISHERLESIHPADLADIVEELGSDEREALFETLDEGVAADTLEEVKPTFKASILHSLDPDRAADILEEMDPGEAADALASLQRHAREDIVRDMEREPAGEVSQLLGLRDNTAGGMMGTRFFSFPEDWTVERAVERLGDEDALVKRSTHGFLVDGSSRLSGALPLGRLAIAGRDTPLRRLTYRKTHSVPINEPADDVIDLFDKYNLYALPVVDGDDRIHGVITADDVITYLKPAIERGL